MKAYFIEHRGENRIKIEVEYTTEAIEKVKAIPDRLWSITHKAWHIPHTKEAMEMLKLAFPKVEFVDEKKAKLVKEKPIEEKAAIHESVKKQILIHVVGRKIIIRMPGKEEDVNFIRNLKYSSWDKRNYYWTLPNYQGNLELLKNHFGERISSVTIAESIYESDGTTRVPANDEVILIKCTNGRLKLVGFYNKELHEALKAIFLRTLPEIGHIGRRYPSSPLLSHSFSLKI